MSGNCQLPTGCLVDAPTGEINCIIIAKYQIPIVQGEVNHKECACIGRCASKGVCIAVLPLCLCLWFSVPVSASPLSVSLSLCLWARTCMPVYCAFSMFAWCVGARVYGYACFPVSLYISACASAYNIYIPVSF